MSGLFTMVTKYRWALLLFIGFPLLSDAVALEALTLPIRLILLALRITGLMIPSPNIVALGIFSLHILTCLLGIFYYFHVRRSGRRTLSLVWAYAFAGAAVGAVVTWVPDLDFPSDWSATGAKALAGIIVLLWFARKASRISLGHAFLLVGLSTAVQGSGTVPVHLAAPWIESNPVYWLISLLAIAQGLLAVWVLAHFDSARTFPRNAIISLFVLDGALHVAAGIAMDGLPAAQVLLSVAVMLAAWAAWYAVVILLCYLARARQPIDPGPCELGGRTWLPPWGPLKAILNPRR